MLTPIDIQNKVLKTGMGYNKKDVDDFIIDIMQNYEALYKQNVELKEKIATLSEGIQYYKTIETTLQKALVLAEKTAKETKDAAIQKAEAMEKEARVKANIIIADARNDLETIRTQTINLIQNYESFRLQFKKIASTQMELVESESFQIYAPDLEALLNGEADALHIASDSMADYYPEGASEVAKDTIAAANMSTQAKEQEAAREQKEGQAAYEAVMQQSQSVPDTPSYTTTGDVSSPVQPYNNNTESVSQSAYTAQAEKTVSSDNPYISRDLQQEGQEVDQMIGNLYEDLNTRSQDASATPAPDGAAQTVQTQNVAGTVPAANVAVSAADAAVPSDVPPYYTTETVGTQANEAYAVQTELMQTSYETQAAQPSSYAQAGTQTQPQGQSEDTVFEFFNTED